MKVSRFTAALLIVTIMVTAGVVAVEVLPTPVAEVVSTSPFEPIEVECGESQKKAHILIVPSSTRGNSFEFRLNVSPDLVKKPDKWKEMLVGINQPSPTFQTSVGYNAPDGVWFKVKTDTPLVSGVYPISLQIDPETSYVSEWKVVVWAI